MIRRATPQNPIPCSDSLHKLLNIKIQLMASSILPSSSLFLVRPKWAVRAPCPSHFPVFLSPAFPSSVCFTTSLEQPLLLSQARKVRGVQLRSSASQSTLTDSSERWLLEPAGDGDTRHIGSNVPLPGAFEVSSNVVTVGRFSEKADVVLPIDTVSGLHARLENKGGNLLVVDLGSTNGTFVNEKKVKPGDAVNAPPGSTITFGDTHLAVFRIKKIEEQELESREDRKEDEKEAEPETKSVTNEPTDSSVTAS